MHRFFPIAAQALVTSLLPILARLETNSHASIFINFSNIFSPCAKKIANYRISINHLVPGAGLASVFCLLYTKIGAKKFNRQRPLAISGTFKCLLLHFSLLTGSDRTGPTDRPTHYLLPEQIETQCLDVPFKFCERESGRLLNGQGGRLEPDCSLGVPSSREFSWLLIRRPVRSLQINLKPVCKYC